jgi:hypothetical protein
MKTNMKYLLVMAATGVVLVCVAGPTIIITPPAPPAVVVTAPVPPPIPVTVAVVPDTYVWDGTEYVGVVGDQYYYLGSGNAWIVMDADRLHRFHTWQQVHADWRDHAIRNVKYRGPVHDDHPQPMHEDRPAVHDDHSDHDHDHNGPPQ